MASYSFYYFASASKMCLLSYSSIFFLNNVGSKAKHPNNAIQIIFVKLAPNLSIVDNVKPVLIWIIFKGINPMNVPKANYFKGMPIY